MTRVRARQGRPIRPPVETRLSSGPLLERHELCAPAQSKSTKKNVKKAEKILAIFARLQGAPDPKEVTENSSSLVCNLLHQYCRLGTPEALTDESVGSIIQGLRILYQQHGHYDNWQVDRHTKRASGNPLCGNSQIAELRRSHRVFLSGLGVTRTRASPFSVNQIVAHAESYWFGSKRSLLHGIDVRDVMIHAILTLAMNTGMRYDEVSKLLVENVALDGIDVHLFIPGCTKNATIPKFYRLQNWPGNSALRHSVLLDAQLALMTWIILRGTLSGPLFCGLKQTSAGMVLDRAVAFSVERFTNFIQGRLRSMGTGEGYAKTFTGHSLKRGSIQLYRSLSIRDSQIRETTKMRGVEAFLAYAAENNNDPEPEVRTNSPGQKFAVPTQSYHRFCVENNDCAPPDLPSFQSKEDMIAHALTLLLEDRTE